MTETRNRLGAEEAVLRGANAGDAQASLELAFGSGASASEIATGIGRISAALKGLRASSIGMIVGDTGGAYAYEQAGRLYLSKTMVSDMMSGTFAGGTFAHEAAHVAGMGHEDYDRFIKGARNGMDIARNFARQGSRNQILRTRSNPYNYDVYFESRGSF